MENGQRVTRSKNLNEIAEYSQKQLDKLPGEFKQFENPHIYKVGLSNSLKEDHDRLVDQMKAKVSQ